MTTRHRRDTPIRRRRWSSNVTENSHAMDLEENVFTQRDPRAIARSLKRSSERSETRKSDPFRSAMSMLTFYVNRAGKHLNATQKHKLEQAKDELRKLFKRPVKSSTQAHSQRNS